MYKAKVNIKEGQIIKNPENLFDDFDSNVRLFDTHTPNSLTYVTMANELDNLKLTFLVGKEETYGVTLQMKLRYDSVDSVFESDNPFYIINTFIPCLKSFLNNGIIGSRKDWEDVQKALVQFNEHSLMQFEEVLIKAEEKGLLV